MKWKKKFSCRAVSEGAVSEERDFNFSAIYGANSDADCFQSLALGRHLSGSFNNTRNFKVFPFILRWLIFYGCLVGRTVVNVMMSSGIMLRKWCLWVCFDRADLNTRNSEPQTSRFNHLITSWRILRWREWQWRRIQNQYWFDSLVFPHFFPRTFFIHGKFHCAVCVCEMMLTKDDHHYA